MATRAIADILANAPKQSITIEHHSIPIFTDLADFSENTNNQTS